MAEQKEAGTFNLSSTQPGTQQLVSCPAFAGLPSILQLGPQQGHRKSSSLGILVKLLKPCLDGIVHPAMIGRNLTLQL